MHSSIVHVQGITLGMDKESNDRLLSKIRYISNNPLNLWKNIDLHLTLHLFSFKTIDEAKVVIPTLENIFSDSKVIEVEVGNAVMNKDGYIYLSILSNNLMLLHLKIIEELKVFTSDKFNPKYLNTNLLPNQLEYLHTYGYHRVKEYFDPHITIAKFEDSNEQLKVFNSITNFKEVLKFNSVSLSDNIDKSYDTSINLWDKQLIY